MVFCRSLAVLPAITWACCAISATAPKAIQPKEGVTILVNDGHSHINIDVIDGVRKGVKPYGKYELKPGMHTLRVRLHYVKGNIEYTGFEFVDYSFQAEPGTVLNVVCKETTVSNEKGSWQMWIEDLASGKRVVERVPESAQIQVPVVPMDTAALERAFASMAEKAEQGDLESQYNLALLYEKGEGVTQDYSAAVQWYKKAAEQGHATAMFAIGLAYELGLGVPEDLPEAYVWFCLAAAGGDSSAHGTDRTKASSIATRPVAPTSPGRTKSARMTGHRASPTEA